MKKTQRAIIGFAATCICFFVAMLAGSFTEPMKNITASGEEFNISSAETPTPPMERETSGTNELLTDTPEVVASPTPTLSPTPTVSPTPTPSPSPTVSPTPTISPTPTMAPYVPGFTISGISGNLNIRKGPGTDHEIIGKLYKNNYALLLEDHEDDGWARITTGTIKEGYVSMDYLLPAGEVIRRCDEEKLITAKSTVETLNVRSGPSTSYDAIDKIKLGQAFLAVLGESFDGWIALQLTDGSSGYVAEKYVEFSLDLQPGLATEEVLNRERQASMEAAMARNMVSSVPETTRTTKHTMTDEEMYLFATVIYTEAGDQVYEGMVAVANVILNRMEDGYWGASLEEVLFAPGQFAGASDYLIKRAQNRGIPEKCYKAAREALNGRNNIGDYMFFRTTDSAFRAKDYATYTNFYILDGHVFYKKNW